MRFQYSLSKALKVSSKKCDESVTSHGFLLNFIEHKIDATIAGKITSVVKVGLWSEVFG
jgi:hypothetical protein